MEYTLKNGQTITDEEVALMAGAYERGEWPGDPVGEVIVGCPRLSQEPTKTISFEVPASLAELVAKAAEKSGESQSSFLRKAARRAVDEVLV